MFNFLRSLFNPKPRIVIPVPKFKPYTPQFEYTSNTTTIVLKPEPKSKAVKAKPAKKTLVVKTKANRAAVSEEVKPTSTPRKTEEDNIIPSTAFYISDSSSYSSDSNSSCDSGSSSSSCD